MKSFPETSETPAFQTQVSRNQYVTQHKSTSNRNFSTADDHVPPGFPVFPVFPILVSSFAKAGPRAPSRLGNHENGRFLKIRGISLEMFEKYGKGVCKCLTILWRWEWESPNAVIGMPWESSHVQDLQRTGGGCNLDDMVLLQFERTLILERLLIHALHCSSFKSFQQLLFFICVPSIPITYLR